MKNLKYLLLLMVAASLSFVSCTKDDDDDGDSDVDGPVVKTDMLITKATYAVDGRYQKFTYNADNTLQKIQNFSSADVDLNYYDEFTYNNGKLNTYIHYTNGTPNTKITMSYNGDMPSTAELQSNQGDGLVYDYNVDYTFDGDKLKKLEYRKGTSIQIEKVYTYSGDEIIREDVAIGGAPSDYTEYTYDSKKNAMHGIGLDYFVGEGDYIMENNYTQVKKSSASDQLNEAMSVNITYEYDANDYITKSTSLSFNGQTETVITYTLEVK